MTDTMKQAFDKFFCNNVDVKFDNVCTAYFEGGYQAAQADIKKQMQDALEDMERERVGKNIFGYAIHDNAIDRCAHILRDKFKTLLEDTND